MIIKKSMCQRNIIRVLTASGRVWGCVTQDNIFTDDPLDVTTTADIALLRYVIPYFEELPPIVRQYMTFKIKTTFALRCYQWRYVIT